MPQQSKKSVFKKRVLLESPLKTRPELLPPPPTLIKSKKDELTIGKSKMTRIFIGLVVSVVASVTFTAVILTTSIPSTILVASLIFVWAVSMLVVSLALKK